jgi:hypothetical protein
MTDFVTRLEDELHAAALRQEHRGRARGATLPRIRIALGGVPTTALAVGLLGLAVAACAILLSMSPRQGAAGELPRTLTGVWRGPPTELRLYAEGSQRCVNLGLGSSAPCYTLGESGTRVATEWGRVSVTGDTLKLRSRLGTGTGVYRWSITGGALRLTKVSDRDEARVRALIAMPLASTEHADRHPGVPVGWSVQRIASKRFGYALRVPHFWSLNDAGRADRLSGESWHHVLPEVSVTTGGTGVSSGCTPYSSRRLLVGGTNIGVAVYRTCGAPNVEVASFVHGGRDYRVTWRGKATRPEADYPRFDAMLKTLTFVP